MPKVSSLVIKPQTGGNSTHYASWKFVTTKTTTTGGSSSSGGAFKKDDLVSIKSGATYYNGVGIPQWVMNQKWYLLQVYGDRAVLGYNQSRDNNICSAINTKNITKGTATGSSGTKTTTTETRVANLDHYEVKWYYDTGDGVWFSGGSSDVKEDNATYNAPDNAVRIKVTVLPIAKTYEKKTNNETKQVPYWTGTSVAATYLLANNPPTKPSTPSVEVDKFKLTASLKNISDARTDRIKFEVYNGTKLYKTGVTDVLTRQATFVCNISAGGKYRVRCQAINISNGVSIPGPWSDYSDDESTIPLPPSGITTIKAVSETSVYLEWPVVNEATSYKIEYATEKRYLDGSDSTTTVSDIKQNHYEKTGLEAGDEYFFRVCSVNQNGESTWSGIVSIIIGKKPSAPTTWSSTTTAISGEKLILYWVHNSVDNSSQTFAELEIYLNSKKQVTRTIKNSTDEEEKDKTSFFSVDTSSYKEGVKIEWRVRTAGITKTYGDWSIMRSVDIYAPPTLRLEIQTKSGTVINTIKSFPFYISALAGPKTQSPISYHVLITSTESYEMRDYTGNVKIVNSGDSVYSKHFDTAEALLIEMSASNVDLENNVLYELTVTVYMDSGLTSEAKQTFDVSWTDEFYEPDASVVIDPLIYVSYITPFCVDADENLIPNILLSVYRREFDGELVEIVTGLENERRAVITDPHPALDYARYRIVAIKQDTGAVSYYDLPPIPVSGKEIIIQWNETYRDFYRTDPALMEGDIWAGSMVKLPYNIDTSESNKSDVSLIEYIGRSHPVSYYGTQLGETATWNVDIDKEDTDTLYLLRKLKKYMGDVYVREPSGVGYWANISVSFSQKHTELIIPVSISLTRVEGGV